MLTPSFAPETVSMDAHISAPLSLSPLQNFVRAGVLSATLSSCQNEIEGGQCTKDIASDSIDACLAKDRQIVYENRSRLITPDGMEQFPLNAVTVCKTVGPDSEGEYCLEQSIDLCDVADKEARTLIDSEEADWVGTAVTFESTLLSTGDVVGCCVTAVNYGPAPKESETVVDCEIVLGAPVALSCKGLSDDEVVATLCEN